VARRAWVAALGAYLAAMAAAIALALRPPGPGPAIPVTAPVGGAPAPQASWAYRRLAAPERARAEAVVRLAGRLVTEALGGYAPTVAGLLGAALPGLGAGPG
jgi:hypothetical protein